MNTDNKLPNLPLYKNAVQAYENRMGEDRLKLYAKIHSIASVTFITASVAANTASAIISIATMTFTPILITASLSFLAVMITRAVSGLFGFKIQKFEAGVLLKALTESPADSDEGKRASVIWKRINEDTLRQTLRNQGKFGEWLDLYVGLLSLEHIKMFCEVDSIEELYVTQA